jgi:hypothetical protein
MKAGSVVILYIQGARHGRNSVQCKTQLSPHERCGVQSSTRYNLPLLLLTVRLGLHRFGVNSKAINA